MLVGLGGDWAGKPVPFRGGTDFDIDRSPLNYETYGRIQAFDFVDFSRVETESSL
jgi:hypothetical protein